jgi:hypothetical protein
MKRQASSQLIEKMLFVIDSEVKKKKISFYFLLCNIKNGEKIYYNSKIEMFAILFYAIEYLSALFIAFFILIFKNLDPSNLFNNVIMGSYI